MGRCPSCGEWNCVIEKERPRASGTVRVAAAQRLEASRIPSLAEVRVDEAPRLKTGMDELDRVLGGGVVRRSVILLGGDPGIGKSTLLMQALAGLGSQGEKVLYVSGEESAEQLRLRAERLGIDSSSLLVLMENELESVLGQLDAVNPSVLVLDSVQAVGSREIDSPMGGLNQVRLVGSAITEHIKRGSGACFLVGHVTKGGDIAGPKALEHIVDTVLYFEGDRSQSHRILRAVKNRYGSVSEIGVFEMCESGLREVANPSELYMRRRPKDVSGTVVTPLIEGSRPILTEIQALVSAPGPGQGRRTCLGVDSQRLALIVAVIEKKLGLALVNNDIFVNAVGGVRAVEPATDLAVAAALLSSFTDRVIPSGTVVFGELGLAGEVRKVTAAESRIREAVRLGFDRVIAPQGTFDDVKPPKSFTGVSLSLLKELGGKLFG
jgi:DNA repair protein RadA/Sms